MPMPLFLLSFEWYDGTVWITSTAEQCHNVCIVIYEHESRYLLAFLIRYLIANSAGYFRDCFSFTMIDLLMNQTPFLRALFTFFKYNFKWNSSIWMEFKRNIVAYGIGFSSDLNVRKWKWWKKTNWTTVSDRVLFIVSDLETEFLSMISLRGHSIQTLNSRDIECFWFNSHSIVSYKSPCFCSCSVIKTKFRPSIINCFTIDSN